MAHHYVAAHTAGCRGCGELCDDVVMMQQRSARQGVGCASQVTMMTLYTATRKTSLLTLPYLTFGVDVALSPVGL